MSMLKTCFRRIAQSEAATEKLIAERIQARADRNWQREDQIRAELLSQGIELEDGEKETVWRRMTE